MGRCRRPRPRVRGDGVLVAFWSRAFRPDPAGELPNANDPALNPPATVGPPSVNPGDPDGVLFTGADVPWQPPPRVTASAWSGWPDGWATPLWNGGGLQLLTDTAWLCLDRNSNILASLPPYLVGAAGSLNADWLTNPDPDQYTCWPEFVKNLFFDYQGAGEAFVWATSYYATGYPARFHVVPPYFVDVEIREGQRVYRIGDIDVTGDILHVRYKSSVGSPRGVGPLDAGAMRMVADRVLTEYGTKIASIGVPGVLAFPNGVSQEQAELAKAQWVAARQSGVGEPAVVSGGITWTPTSVNPTELGHLDLLKFQQARIAELLGIPPPVVSLPSGADSLTYNTAVMLRSQHWEQGLRPMAEMVMAALSGWALPRGTAVELNGNAYMRPDPYERAQTYQILSAIVDPATGKQALTVDEIRTAERLDDVSPANVSKGAMG